MSKNGAGSAPSVLANKAQQQQKRQSFLKRLAQPHHYHHQHRNHHTNNNNNNTMPPEQQPQQSSKSTPFLSPPPSPPSSTCHHQQPSITGKKQLQQQQSPPPPMSRLQSVRLTLIASVSRRRPRCSSNAATTKTANTTTDSNSSRAATSTNAVNKKRQKQDERRSAPIRMSPTKKRDRVDSIITSITSTTGATSGGNSNTSSNREESLYAPPTSRNMLVAAKDVQTKEEQECIEPIKPRQQQRPLSHQPSPRHHQQQQQQQPVVLSERPLSQLPPSPPSSLVAQRQPSYFQHDEELLPPWQRRSMPSSATTMALHSRIVSRQSSMSSSSSSSSSVRTLAHDPGKSKFLSKLSSKSIETAATTTTTHQQHQPNYNNNNINSYHAAPMLCDNNNNKQELPTPVVSCSSIYPSFESPRRTTLLTSTKSTERVVMMKPTRARTMFAVVGGVHKKEVKAISVWRQTVTKLLLASDNEHSTINSNDEIGKNNYNDAGSLITNKDRALCKFIINELYTTEKSYHRLLRLIQTRYMQPMIAASQEASSLVKEGDIPVLFRHLPEMLQLSEKILQCFEDEPSPQGRFHNTPCLVRIGRMFQMLEQEMVVFLKYAVHYEAHSKLIRRACSNVLFLKIEQESLTRKDTNRMGIADYLIAPFQRVPRYCLLIKDLIKHTDRSDPQFAELDVALKMLTGLTVAMDHVQKIPR